MRISLTRAIGRFSAVLYGNLDVSNAMGARATCLLSLLRIVDSITSQFFPTSKKDSATEYSAGADYKFGRDVFCGKNGEIPKLSASRVNLEFHYKVTFMEIFSPRRRYKACMSNAIPV